MEAGEEKLGFSKANESKADTCYFFCDSQCNLCVYSEVIPLSSMVFTPTKVLLGLQPLSLLKFTLVTPPKGQTNIEMLIDVGPQL